MVVRVTAAPKLTAPVDVDRAETRWCAYAWPLEHGRTGNRTFFVDPEGNVLETDDPRYSGQSGPAPGAALVGGALESVRGTPARNATGQDGNTWRE